MCKLINKNSRLIRGSNSNSLFHKSLLLSQELLALLHHLDKENKGYVSVIEFAQGLQAIKNSVAVGTTTPTHQSIPRRGFSEV